MGCINADVVFLNGPLWYVCQHFSFIKTLVINVVVNGNKKFENLSFEFPRQPQRQTGAVGCFRFDPELLQVNYYISTLSYPSRKIAASLRTPQK